MQIAPGAEPQRELVHEIRLEEPSLVMTLLRPGIGEEDMDTGERCGGDHRCHELDRVVLDHANVAETELGDASQQAANPR